jgi:hypothetical protein
LICWPFGWLKIVRCAYVATTRPCWKIFSETPTSFIIGDNLAASKPLHPMGFARARGLKRTPICSGACATFFPRTHELFLQCLRYSFYCGDFLFVHAGIRPGIPIEQQDINDLIWIRHEFLDSAQTHEKFVVHGHTPVPHPDIRPNRINIDTGAWHTGILTCIAIEGTTILVL